LELAAAAAERMVVEIVQIFPMKKLSWFLSLRFCIGFVLS
jgi:hypothetical protein